MDRNEHFLRRAERLLKLASEVERTAEELVATNATESHWRRQRRVALLKAAIEYGVAMHRNLRRPRLRKR